MNVHKQKQYPFDDSQEFNEANVEALVKGVADGSIKPHFKSEPIPEKNDDPVVVVVGHTFNDLVLNNDKDVFVEFYAPCTPPPMQLFATLPLAFACVHTFQLTF